MANSERKSRGWLFDFLTLVTVIIGLIYGALELRSIRVAQEGATVLELFRTIQTPEYSRAVRFLHELPDTISYDEFREMPEEDRLLLTNLVLTWESIGIMVFRGDVSIEWVDELYRYNILMSWQKLGPMERGQREASGYSGMAEWFQWLAERLEARSQGRDPVPAYEAHADWRG